MPYDYDLVVIGGGAAGLVVTSAAAQLGAKVLLVEKHRLGGDCLWAGCVPSKSLIHQARRLQDLRCAFQDGLITSPSWHLNPTAICRHIQQVQATIARHDAPERFQSLGAEVVIGQGSFCDPQTFSLNGRAIRARAYVIATGSRPRLPGIPGLAEVGFLTNEQVFGLDRIPDRLGVIGAGPMGCELAQAFARLGSRVSVVARQVLPKQDAEAVAVVAAQLQQEGVEFLLGERVRAVASQGAAKVMQIGETHREVDEILLACGRIPNLEGLGLEAAQVAYTPAGIQVNAHLQTSNPRIFACGDVIGDPCLTHVAAYEGAVALVNSLLFPLQRVSYRLIPQVIFTDPELAQVGYGQAAAVERYGAAQVLILKQDFAGVDRAQTEASPKGFAKVLCRPNGQILGATLVGSRAGEFLGEIVLAMKHQLPVTALSGIHAYPTWGEVLGKVALQFRRQNFQPWQQQILRGLWQWWRR